MTTRMNKKTNLSCAALVVLGLSPLVASCSNTDMSGSTKPAAKATTSPANCQPGTTITTMNLLTPSVDQNSSTPVVRYEMTLTDCPGTVPQALADKLSFDLDATLSDRNNSTWSADIGYSISVTGATTAMSGTMLYQGGADLFGNAGQNFGHYDTDRSVSFAATDRKAIVTIDLRTILVKQPRDAVPGSVLPGAAMTINTYFKFGSQMPVMVPVIFNAPR